MSLLLVSIISFLGIILGRFIFKKWFNHLTLYCIIFGGMVFLYELKFLPYPNLIPITWFVIISSFLCFLFGILTIISARNLFKENPKVIEKSDISLRIFADGGKTLKYALIFFSIISLYSAIEFWMILLKEFGSIPAVFINGNLIYRMNVNGELKGTTPYIFIVSFVAVFFAGVYTAYKGKFTILSFIPLVSVIIKDIGGAGRATMTLALMEFAFSFFLFRYMLNNDLLGRYKFSRKNILIAGVILIVVFILSISLVRLSRNVSGENYLGASKELRGANENILISPSVYLYASSSIGVLTKYMESQGENTRFGEHSLQSIYLLLAKFKLVEKPLIFQKGYYIPLWTNNGTYLRELHADYGIAGVFIGPFLLGLLLTWLWFKFYEGKSLIVFALLVHLFLIVGFSFFFNGNQILLLDYWVRYNSYKYTNYRKNCII